MARRQTGVGRAVVALATAVFLTAACDFGQDAGVDGGGALPTATPAVAAGDSSAEEALQRFVERRLRQGFVADCDEAQRPGDVGKQCARFRGERGDLRAYDLGPTFAEYTRLIILKRVEGGWTIAHLENRDPNLPPVPGIPWPLAVGASVVVAGTGDCLRAREEPGVRAPVLHCLEDGTAVTIGAGPVRVDDLEWWELEGFGWAASDWLRYPEEVPALPTIASPTPDGE